MAPPVEEIFPQRERISATHPLASKWRVAAPSPAPRTAAGVAPRASPAGWRSGSGYPSSPRTPGEGLYQVGTNVARLTLWQDCHQVRPRPGPSVAETTLAQDCANVRSATVPRMRARATRMPENRAAPL